MVLLVSAGVAAARRPSGATSAETVTVPSRETAPREAPATPAKRNPWVVLVAIDPPSARVVVDGKATRVVNGEINLEGTLGQTREIALSANGAAKTWTVAITQHGAMPKNLALPRAMQMKPVSRPSAAAQPVVPGSMSATAAPEQPEPDLRGGVGRVGVVSSFE
jgi:hypothetical protein